MSACRVAGFGHHSMDLVTEWHGRPAPLVMCGKHHQQLGLRRFSVWRHIQAAPDGLRFAGYVDVVTDGTDAGAYTMQTGTGSTVSGSGDWSDAVKRHGYETGPGTVFLIHNGAGESFPLYERDWAACPA